jgi:K(+)-stimulated pyrophosphate-energized sodium pump
MSLVWLVPVSGVLAVLFAVFMARDVLRRDPGTPKMQEIGGMIFEGAMAFLKRQYSTIGMLALVTAVVIGGLLGLLASPRELEELQLSRWGLLGYTAVAFLAGAFCSAVSGFIGMYVSVKSNVRCASGAQRGLNEAITVALRGGAVSGFLIVALSLLGVAGIFHLYGGSSRPDIAPHLIVGFGFGASFVALFAQLGGGIYTKAADMGADLVGKVEAGIPEDDPRNAAVVADLVGDNVGDCAGRGADLFESTAAENIGAMILGVAIWKITNNPVWVFFPLVVRALGLIASGIGILVVRGKEGENPMNALNRGYYVAVGLSILGMLLAVSFMLENMWFFWAGAVGILTSVVVVFVTQYYTEPRFRPVREIARASRTGPATNIVAGTAVGYETTFATAIVIGVALLLSYGLGQASGLAHGGVFATAVATMGMLMTCSYILSMDTFGPITDNANGIIEMAGAGDKARHITDRLDAVGNTTKALTKGYAMVSAGLAAFLLFQAYLDRVAFLKDLESFSIVNLARPEVFVGGFLAVMLVFLFSSLAIRAVGKTASQIIEEVRRQFRADPGIMAGTTRPDYARAVDITTRAGLRQMVAPGLLAVALPVGVGVIFNLISGYDAAMAVGALLMVGTIGGIILASFMNNSGGAWDNAKKLIESGEFRDEEGNVIGKGSLTHAAAVVGDTVGDPFKDTAGPSLHVLVKLLATITLVLSPLFI